MAYVMSWRPTRLGEPARQALVYVRVSTDETTQASLPDQIKMCQAAAASLGLVIPEDGIYKDEMSRSIWTRPGLQAMLQRLDRDDEVAAVIVWQTSRLYGDVEQQIRIYRRLRYNKVRLFDAKLNEENLPGAMNQALSKLKGVLHELEVETLRERVHDTHSVKAETGRILQRPVFGIRHSPERGHYVDQQQLLILREIFDWTSDGVYPQEICDRLNARGVRTPQGCEWNRHNLRRMLRNPIYKGELIWNRTQTVRDENGRRKQIPRPQSEWITTESPLGVLIDPWVFDEAGRVIERRWQARGGGRGYKVYEERTLSGFVFCGVCEKRMYPRRTGHKAASSGARHLWFTFGDVNYHSRSEAKIQAKLQAALLGEDDSVTIEVAQRPGVDLEIDSLKAQLDANKKKSDRTLTLYQEELLDLDAYRTEKRRLDRERSTLEVSLDTARQSLDGNGVERVSARTSEVLARSVPLLFDERVPVARRQHILGSVIERVVVEPNDGLRVVLRETAL